MKRAWPLLAICLLASCAKENDLVGEWTSTSNIQGLDTASETTIFKDGRFRSRTRLTGGGPAEIIVIDTGRWKFIPPNKVKWTLEDVEFTITSPAAGPSAATALERLEAAEPKLIAEANKEPADIIDWKNPNLFTLKSKEHMEVYKRKQ